MLRDQIRLHLIVVIFGFTGILGKLITLDAELIVLYRMSIAGLALGFLLLLGMDKKNFNQKLRLKCLATGVIVGLHWYFFFESIKVSNVSVALVSLSSTALFTSILEPIFHRKKFQVYELIFSLLIIAGMAIVLSFEYAYARGILFGIISAFLASLFTVINSKFVINNSSVTISFYELIGGAAFMLLLITFTNYPMLSNIPGPVDVFYILILALVATALAFVISVSVMRKLSAFTVSLTINLEPLYGIILALLIFGQDEFMSSGFYAGFVVILGTIMLNAYLKRRDRKQRAEFGIQK